MTLPTGLRQTNGGLAAPPFTKGPYTWDQDVTLSGTNTLSGTTTLSGATVLSGGTTTATDLRFSESIYTASGAIASGVSCVALNSSGVIINMTITAPVAGRFLTIYHKDSSTASHVVTLTAGTFDGSASTATFDAQNETLVLFGVSATRFVVVENIGSVVLA